MSSYDEYDGQSNYGTTQNFQSDSLLTPAFVLGCTAAPVTNSGYDRILDGDIAFELTCLITAHC